MKKSIYIYIYIKKKKRVRQKRKDSNGRLEDGLSVCLLPHLIHCGLLLFQWDTKTNYKR